MPGEPPMYYFAYGANLSSSTLARRGAAAAVLQRQPAVVADARLFLSFCHRGGYATLLHANQAREGPVWPWGSAESQAYSGGRPRRLRHSYARPHGALLTLSPEALAKLAASEIGYDLRTLQVQPYGSAQAVQAATFMSSPLLLLRGSVAPTRRYLRLLTAGAAECGLDPGYRAWLESLEGDAVEESAARSDPAYGDTAAEAAARALAAAALLGASWAAAGAARSPHL